MDRIDSMMKKNIMSKSIFSKEGSDSITVLSSLRMAGMVFSVFKGLNRRIVRNDDEL